MASYKKIHNKDGSTAYRIIVSMGRKKQISKVWHYPETWSEKTIKKELVKAAANFENECKQGLILTRSERKQKEEQQRIEEAKILTFDKYYNLVFIPRISAELAENTVIYYKYCIDTFAAPKFHNMKMTDIKAAELQALMTESMTTTHAQKTLYGLHAALKRLFTMAYDIGSISENPMQKIPRPTRSKGKRVKKELSAFTPAEVKQILSYLQNEPLKWRCFVRLALDTGARRGELCALQWNDIDFTSGQVTISKSANYTPEKGVFISTTKTGGTRSFGISNDVLSLLKEYRQEQAKQCISPWIFSYTNCIDPPSPTTITRYFERFSQKYGVKDFHPHKLRHTFASIAINSGAAISSVSNKLGHSQISTTLDMYTHPDPDKIEQASEIFRQAIQEA